MAKTAANSAETLVNSAISDALNSLDVEDPFKNLNITSLEELEQALKNTEEGLSLPPEIYEAYQKFL